MNRPTHTLNPNTKREIQINGVFFWNLLKHGFKYDEKLNRLYDKPLPPGTTKYVRKSRIICLNNRSWLLEDQNTMSYSVTTLDHEAVNGCKWRKWRPKRTIMIQSTRRYSWTNRTMIRTISRPSPSMSTSMNTKMTKMDMWYFYSRS